MATEDILKIAGAIVVVLIAIGSIVWYIQANAGHEVSRINAPAGSNPKVQAMKEQQAAGSTGTAPGGNPRAGGKDPMDQGGK